LTVFKGLENVSGHIVMGNETLTDKQGATFEDDDPKLAALLAESEPSGSEYKQPEGDDDSATDPEPPTSSEEGLELEDDAPDTRICLKAGGKKQKKGIVARNQISAAVAAINDEPSPFGDSAAVSKSHQIGYGFSI
jgi:hypothetical protein